MKYTGIAVIGTIVVGLILLISTIIGITNQEVVLRTTIEAKQLDNTSEFDNMFKKIKQTAQVPDAYFAKLKDLVVSYADARTSPNAGAVMNWVQEAVPNASPEMYNNLQNIITSSRDRWTMRQKELIDINREHTKLLRTFPNNVILSLFGRKEITLKIVTSTKTEESFSTGKDDDLKLFN